MIAATNAARPIRLMMFLIFVLSVLRASLRFWRNGWGRLRYWLVYTSVLQPAPDAGVAPVPKSLFQTPEGSEQYAFVPEFVELGMDVNSKLVATVLPAESTNVVAPAL